MSEVKRYAKPRPQFPLSPHRRGWCKRIGSLGVVVVCGHLPPAEALKIWTARAPELYAKAEAKKAGKVVMPVAISPPAPAAPAVVIPPKPTITVPELAERYLSRKESEYRAGTLDGRSLISIQEAMNQFKAAVTKPVCELTPDDFWEHRLKLQKRYSVYALNRTITAIKTLFNWGLANELIDRLPRYADQFEKASAADIRRHRQEITLKYGRGLLTPAQIKALLAVADVQMKAMVLLGLNAAFGNTDIAQLQVGCVDLNTRMLQFIRPKTGCERRCVLWRETVDAIRDVIDSRPVAAKEEYGRLLFLTDKGFPIVRSDACEDDGKLKIKKKDLVATRFRSLMIKAKIDMKIGLGFYSLRHTFRTAADALSDQHAILLVMGHSIPGISAHYVRDISAQRLEHVSQYVHDQFFPVDMNVISVSSI